MKFGQNFAIAAAAGLLFSGCASIQSGTTQELQINSNPAGAIVYIGTTSKEDDGAMLNRTPVGVTPMTIRLPRKDGAVSVEKQGFRPARLTLNTKMNAWVWGDIILGSPLSTSIDTSTGAFNEYDPGEYMVDLKPMTTR